jgi:hypothetical protein
MTTVTKHTHIHKYHPKVPNSLSSKLSPTNQQTIVHYTYRQILIISHHGPISRVEIFTMKTSNEPISTQVFPMALNTLNVTVVQKIYTEY